MIIFDKKNTQIRSTAATDVVFFFQYVGGKNKNKTEMPIFFSHQT